MGSFAHETPPVTHCLSYSCESYVAPISTEPGVKVEVAVTDAQVHYFNKLIESLVQKHLGSVLASCSYSKMPKINKAHAWGGG